MSLHYLDDFILVANDHLEAVFQKNTLKNSVEKLGVPMEVSKLEGPSQTLKSWGLKCTPSNYSCISHQISSLNQKRNWPISF